MITIFCTPRPFKGIFYHIQKNGIKSWMALEPKCQILLFEDEEGTTKRIADELGLECLDAKRNEFGSLLLDGVFAKVAERAKGDILAHVDPDILLKNDFIKALNKVKEKFGDKQFLVVGRRWDAEVEGELSFSAKEWEEFINKVIKEKGELHGLAGMDYWGFPKSFVSGMAPVVVGRPGGDSWLVFRARSMGIPVIDATPVVDILHQKHKRPHAQKDFFKIETQRNTKIAGGLANMMTLRDADYLLAEKGIIKPPFFRWLYSRLSMFYLFRLLFSLKRRYGLFK